MSDITLEANVLVTDQALMDVIEHILGTPAGAKLLDELLLEHTELIARAVYPLLKEALLGELNG